MDGIDENVRNFIILLDIEPYYMPNFHQRHEFERRIRAIGYILELVPEAEADVRIVSINNYDRFASCSRGRIEHYHEYLEFPKLVIACVSIAFKEIRSRTNQQVFILRCYLRELELQNYVTVEEIERYELLLLRALRWRHSVTARNFLVLYPYLICIEFPEESIQRATRLLSVMYTEIRFLWSRPSEMAAAALQIESLFRYSDDPFRRIRSRFRVYMRSNLCYYVLLSDIVGNLPEWSVLVPEMVSRAIIGAALSLVLNISLELMGQRTLLGGETAELGRGNRFQFFMQLPDRTRRVPLGGEAAWLPPFLTQVPGGRDVFIAVTPSERPAMPEDLIHLIRSFTALSLAGLGLTLPGPAVQRTLPGVASSVIGPTPAAVPTSGDNHQPAAGNPQLNRETPPGDLYRKGIPPTPDLFCPESALSSDLLSPENLWVAYNGEQQRKRIRAGEFGAARNPQLNIDTGPGDLLCRESPSFDFANKQHKGIPAGQQAAIYSQLNQEATKDPPGDHLHLAMGGTEDKDKDFNMGEAEEEDKHADMVSNSTETHEDFDSTDDEQDGIEEHGSQDSRQNTQDLD